MNTEREDRHGEYWPSPFAITFNVKKVWAWLVSLFLLAGVANAQVSYCGVDVAKDFVPYGGVAKQTLSNLVKSSEAFSNATYWTVSGAALSADSITAPDGASTADTLTASAGSSQHYVWVASAHDYAATASSIYRHSVYVKAGTSNTILLGEARDAVAHGAMFNLGTGAISMRTGIIDASIRAVGVDGWYNVSITYVRTNSTDAGMILGFTDGTNGWISGISFSASGTETMYVWGASAQLASAPADYLATTTTALTLGPLCPVGYTQSLTDPSRCFIVGPVTSRTIRTW